MSYVFELPEVGEGVTEAELVKWSVAVGEVIAPDQVVCEVMTDKATMEINCPVGGTVVEVCGEEGDILPVHAALLNYHRWSAPAPNRNQKQHPHQRKRLPHHCFQLQASPCTKQYTKPIW